MTFSIRPSKVAIPAHSTISLKASFTPNALGPSQQQLELRLSPVEGDWAPVTSTVMLRGEGTAVPVRLQAEHFNLKV